MRKNFGPKPYTYPQPVFIVATYGENGEPDAMNAAWGGISDDTQISLCLSAGHKTVRNLRERGAFTVSMADAKHVVECDYLGVVSANDEPKKLEIAGFHAVKSDFVDAPLLEELPMALECRVVWSARSSMCPPTARSSTKRAKSTRKSWTRSRSTRCITPIAVWATSSATPSATGFR